MTEPLAIEELARLMLMTVPEILEHDNPGMGLHNIRRTSGDKSLGTTEPAAPSVALLYNLGRASRLALDFIRSYKPKPVLRRQSNKVDIHDLKERNDIVEVAGRYTRLIKAGRTFRAVWPFHSQKEASFTVYPDRQTRHCFEACNTGGDGIAPVMKAENLDFMGAIARLGGR